MRRTLPMLTAPFILLSLILLGSNLSVYAATDSGEESLVATVDEQKVTNKEMEAALKQQLYDLDNQRYQTERQWVDDRVNQLLEQREADRRKISVKELENLEITRKAERTSDADLKKFYDAKKDSF